MPRAISNDAKHWLARADEARANAAKIIDPEAKRAMLEIAKSYEQIAARAKGREHPNQNEA